LLTLSRLETATLLPYAIDTEQHYTTIQPMAPLAESSTRSPARTRSNQAVGFAEPAWLSVAQLCRRWQLDRRTIYKFIGAKLLPAWKVGPRLYHVAVADILRFENREG